MITFVRGALLFLAIVSAASGHDLPRTPVQGTPRILGREIPRLILLQPIYHSSSSSDWSFQWKTLLSVIPPGQFGPISEDRDGVFFQAPNGLGQPQSITAKTVFYPGGLYVSKKQPNAIYWYFGNARGQSWVDVSPRPLPVEDQKKFLTGRVPTRAKK
jgi:hypothetical protein